MESNKILKKLEKQSSMGPPPSYHFEHKNERHYIHAIGTLFGKFWQ